MKKEELLGLFKYYKGEEECPYEKGSKEGMWWEGERMFFVSFVEDEGFLRRMIDRLKDAIKEGRVTHPLDDERMGIEQRANIFYLDLWHGKWFPYDDRDLLFDYIKA